jgi:hypothetical protein
MSDHGPESTTPAVPPAGPAKHILPPSAGQAALRGVVALLLVAGGIGAQVAGAGFPSNAPVEMAINFLITVTLIAGGVVLGVFAVLAGVARSVPVVLGRVSVFVVVGVALVLVPVVVWAVGVLPGYLAAIESGDRPRYDGLAGFLVLVGAPWVTGIVMSAVGFRSRNTASRILAIVGIVLGLALVAWAIFAAAIYSAGLTD